MPEPPGQRPRHATGAAGSQRPDPSKTSGGYREVRSGLHRDRSSGMIPATVLAGRFGLERDGWAWRRIRLCLGSRSIPSTRWPTSTRRVLPATSSTRP